MKKSLSERDICTQYIAPAIVMAGWNLHRQVREEVTFTAFQIIWRLWKSRQKKRILYLADRNILIDQTMVNDFKPFGSVMTKIKQRKVDKSFEIYLALYQGISGSEEFQNIYREFSPDFFDLIVVDECHRGSAAEDSAWREILTYFSNATHIGMTATPRETKYISNIHYFGEPDYTYSLRQGIDDGFLAPYKVVRIDIDKDTGWRPTAGKTDKYGNEVPDRIYNQKDYDREMVLVDEEHGDPLELLAKYKNLMAEVAEVRDNLKQELMAALEGRQRAILKSIRPMMARPPWKSVLTGKPYG